MLHVKKVLCLVLAAAVSSDAIGGVLFLAQKSYINAIDRAKTSIISKFESMTKNLKSASGKTLYRLGQLVHRDIHTIIESQMQYDTWEASMSDQLFSILHEALGRLDNAKDEVETYVVMYKQNRIPEDEAVKFIKEDKFQLPKIVASAVARFNEVGRIIKKVPAI